MSQLIYWVFEKVGHPNFNITSRIGVGAEQDVEVKFTQTKYSEEADDVETQFCQKVATAQELEKHYKYRYLNTIRYSLRDNVYVIEPIKDYHSEEILDYTRDEIIKSRANGEGVIVNWLRE